MTLYLIAAILVTSLGALAAIWHAGYNAGFTEATANALQVKQEIDARNLSVYRQMAVEVAHGRDADLTDSRLRAGSF